MIYASRMDWPEFILKALPLIGAASLASAWLGAYFERKKSRTARRHELIDSWRRDLLPTLEGPQKIESGSAKYPFMRLPAYASLRPHLTARFVKELEDGIMRVQADDIYPRKQLLAEIERIAREWDVD
jgi:hypothetical protein